MAALYFSGYNHTSNISYHISRATSKNVFWTKILPQTTRSKCYMHPSKAKLKNRSQIESWQKLLRWDSKKADSNVTYKSHLGAIVCYQPQLLQVLTYLHTTIPCQTRQQYSLFYIEPLPFQNVKWLSTDVSGGRKMITNSQSSCQIICYVILVTYRTNMLYRTTNSILQDDEANTICIVCNLFYNF